MATFSKRYKNTFFIAIQSKMMTWLRGLTANPALMIMTVSATSVKFGKSTNRMKSTKFWTMFTTSENYCYKRLYQKVGLLGNESFKCFQTYPGYNVYVKKKWMKKRNSLSDASTNSQDLRGTRLTRLWRGSL